MAFFAIPNRYGTAAAIAILPQRRRESSDRLQARAELRDRQSHRVGTSGGLLSRESLHVDSPSEKEELQRTEKSQ